MNEYKRLTRRQLIRGWLWRRIHPIKRRRNTRALEARLDGRSA